MHSIRHEQVYHAAVSCQAASLSLTGLSLRGLKRACQIESQKNGGFLAPVSRDQYEPEFLGGSTCMKLLGLFKSSCLIALVIGPHGKNDPGPNVGQCSYRHRVTFAFSSLALVIVPGPRFTLRCLPG